MDALVYKTSIAPLQRIVDFFIYFRNNNQTGSYVTFPNANLCLAIYKSNKVSWNRTSNHCHINPLVCPISSKLIGFHKQPFYVSYSGEIDQMCILFRPGALIHFRKDYRSELIHSENPLVELFGPESIFLFEAIFELEAVVSRQKLIEDFLLRNLKSPDLKQQKYLSILASLSNLSCESNKVVEKLSNDLDVDPSTLYRNSLRYFGQSVKEIYKTFRFRKALTDIVVANQLLTQSAIRNGFFDQSHLAKDFRKFTGETPKTFQKKVTSIDKTLLWMKDC